MVAQIIDGKKIAQEIREELKKEVICLKEKGVVPGLATVLVGTDPASQIYIKNKLKSCAEIGIYSYHQHLPAE
ncbi:MAG TPA: bifunctional 5,10-methylene-tetrahydrofolate dehydrogenase/5,10-methylene-tetrahydrofolate cyclohydrolase, partial [Elusimicrobia bacterium]|nr:bifunctional 5,10-methylene-tetrahydrofolate dehydrogenase/5,10-methylene-tetrahydrofolate cyclohydrolase [Elusimicrobiota bacterium]